MWIAPRFIGPCIPGNGALANFLRKFLTLISVKKVSSPK